MEGKFPKSSELQVVAARMQFGADRDPAKLNKKLDEIFATHPKKTEWKTILQWVEAYKGNYTKTREYVGKFDMKTADVDAVVGIVGALHGKLNEKYLAKNKFSDYRKDAAWDKLSNADVRKLAALALSMEDPSVAGTLVGKLNFEKMSEEEKLALA
ncbi:MAG: hypothetical protein N2C14_23465, partial [Planctomycetales bacterium]